MNNRDNRVFTLMQMYIIIIISVIVAILLGDALVSFNDHDYIATVSDKERIVTVDKSYYLIFCKDDDGNYYEFQNTDSLVRLKFDSSTFYNKIEIGEKYKFTVIGYRVRLLSWYENIIKFEKIE